MRKIRREFWFACSDVLFFAGFCGTKPYVWMVRRAINLNGRG
jgi:hypothetical protein